jgi:hypothetical protein
VPPLLWSFRSSVMADAKKPPLTIGTVEAQHTKSMKLAT